MTEEQLAIIEDFKDWSGGFHPSEAADNVEGYIELSYWTTWSEDNKDWLREQIVITSKSFMVNERLQAATITLLLLNMSASYEMMPTEEGWIFSADAEVVPIVTAMLSNLGIQFTEA